MVGALDDSCVFGWFRYPRRTFEQLAAFTDMAAAKGAFDE